jgi:hypothetical protein
MARITEEQNVILKTHKFLESGQLAGQDISRLYTDAHHTLTDYKSLKPFQRFTVDFGDFILYPDLVGQLADGETLFAIEAKGDRDLIKGLAQAEMYQVGFHYSFLAAESSKLTNSYIQFARRKNLGIIAVGDTVNIIHTPEAQMPLREAFRFISRQMETVIQVSAGETYYYNAPTHYLVWAIILEPNIVYSLNDPPDALVKYSVMPKQWQAALRGAQKLKLVKIHGKEFMLTSIGAAIKIILPNSLDIWTKTHQNAGAKGTKLSLAQYNPQAAAVLRLLLLDDPMVRLVMEGLGRSPNRSANFAELAIICDKLDHARAPIFFLNPSSATILSNPQGQIEWNKAKGEDYRSTMFYQYKSILRHAGILSDRRLGGATAKGYNPSLDIWELL